MASLLDAALSRITGSPGVSANASAAPKQSFSEFLNPYITSANVSQTTPNFDPAAEAAAKFQPAITAPAAAAPVYDLYNTARYTASTGFGKPALEVGTMGGKYVPVSGANASDPQVRAQLERSLVNQQKSLTDIQKSPSAYQSVAPMQQSIGAIQSYLNPATGSAAATAAPKPPPSKPVNPGPRAPWQASAQYWKDLDAYKASGGA